jgi:CspA family cold shock protein
MAWWIRTTEEVAMKKGTVKWFSEARGYGFITPDEGGSDLFVRFTGIADWAFKSLAEGARVEFGVREGREGPEAFDVAPMVGAARRLHRTGRAGSTP